MYERPPGFNPVWRDYCFSTDKGYEEIHGKSVFNPVWRDYCFSTILPTLTGTHGTLCFNPVWRDYCFSTATFCRLEKYPIVKCVPCPHFSLFFAGAPPQSGVFGHFYPPTPFGDDRRLPQKQACASPFCLKSGRKQAVLTRLPPKYGGCFQTVATIAFRCVTPRVRRQTIGDVRDGSFCGLFTVTIQVEELLRVQAATCIVNFIIQETNHPHCQRPSTPRPVPVGVSGQWRVRFLPGIRHQHCARQRGHQSAVQSLRQLYGPARC